MDEQKLPEENQEVQIDELDESALEDAAGGGPGATLPTSNSGCNCGC